MKRITLSLIIFTVTLAMAAPVFVKAGDQAASENAQGTHNVIKGDTLWDISGKYLKNPFLWPEVWKQNPEIKNPDLIYPGDRVRIPGMPGEAEAAPAAGKAAEAEAAGAVPEGKPGETAKGKSPFDEEPFVDISQTLLRIPEKEDKKIISLDETAKPKIPVATLGTILEAGFISDDTDHVIPLSGSPMGDREFFTIEDLVYLPKDEDVAPGTLLVTTRDEEDVDHPATGKDMGSLVKVSGLMQVIEIKDGYPVCKIIKSLYDIKKSDMAEPFKEPELVYEPVPKDPALKGEWGYVVAALDNTQLNAPVHAVYLDLGSDDGVKPGDVFTVRRINNKVAYKEPGHYYLVDTERDLPDVDVGEVQVIAVRNKTATAKVLTFDEPIKPGYRVYYKD